MNLGAFSWDIIMARCQSLGNKSPIMKLSRAPPTPYSPIASAFSPKLNAVADPLILSQHACTWRDLQGSTHWENLLNPLHPLLRHEILRYADFVNACYKAFDLDPTSKRHLSCKYGKANMLGQVGLEDSGYQVTKYIYATPDINFPIQNGVPRGRWVGYVAISSDDEVVKKLGRRDLLIAFRGTVTNYEWIASLMSSLTPARLDPRNCRPEVKVESGFLSMYTSKERSGKFGLGSCREQLLSEVSRLVNKHKEDEISITLAGHSLGSALALLLAYDIAEVGIVGTRDHRDIPLTVFSFGGPRVGNLGFKKRCEELGLKVLRIANGNDPVTKLPGVLLNENFRLLGKTCAESPWSCSFYAHVGVELALEHRQRSFLDMRNPSWVHDMETYISLLTYPDATQHEEDIELAALINRFRSFASNLMKGLRLGRSPKQHDS
ncbi:galactolipase DONGLE, chloroplastic-like [Eucalyptus grandis]|uniref:galactolipase DONGLE, chloroplastic-like n=1 Tax=Eucalyptus grandis TaxID=71139 RepID=UPI00192E8ED9|nr:galactolipase DONGLE, chloroplastic-like [Eucalyptus grandis]